VTAGEWTFAFVDLAGFTALTEAHGDELAAQQATRFYELAEQALVGTSQLVKRMGDAVLYAAHKAEEAVSTVWALMETAEAEPNFPEIRAGIHTGSAMRSLDDRGGVDYLGSGVNLAARVAGHATCRQVLITEAVAGALDEETWPLRRLGHVHFRNVVSPVEMFEVIMRDRPEGDVDPVCRMRVAPGAVIASLRHSERDYVFCSLECVAVFAAEPHRYVEATR
jgi:class 3 adenylate cyclase/YHS domain-containing protein